MIELVDWSSTEPENVGTPGFNTLAVTIAGKTRRPGHVFAAAERPTRDGVCRVLIAADLPDIGPEVMTPFSLTVRITIEGVATFILAGATMTEEKTQVSTPPA